MTAAQGHKCAGKIYANLYPKLETFQILSILELICLPRSAQTLFLKPFSLKHVLIEFLLSHV